MMNLSEQLAKFDAIANLQVDEVLKTSDQEVTEVVAYEGHRCIRKTISSQSTGYRTLFETKAQIRNVPSILEYVEMGEKSIVIMEFVEGRKLRAGDPISAFFDVANALTDLHNIGIVHRDVKPSNILFDGRQAWLIDLGIARKMDNEKSQDTTLLGTKQFAPPEQFGFGQTDARTDVYALGMTLYYMLTGKTSEKPLDKAIKAECGKYSDALIRATSFSPADRFQNVEDFKAAIEHPPLINVTPLMARVWNFCIVALWLLIVAASVYAIIVPSGNQYGPLQRAFEFTTFAIIPVTVATYCLFYKRYTKVPALGLKKQVLLMLATCTAMLALVVLAIMIGFL